MGMGPVAPGGPGEGVEANMANRRKAHLDALERRLTGPKRIALFGHRAVGKTTLLAMFYRQASTGQVPGLRLAAVDPPSAEYLAEKIAQIESGEPPAGTLAETELKLRLYHGPARFDLIFKDYQGEDVTLGTDEPIQRFFADSDAVLLCLDPEGSTQPVERRRRQQEVENLLERYIEKSDDGTVGRPVALLLTKFDRVLARGDDLDSVERVVEARYGMTRHALARHVPNGAMFAVSSYGRAANGDGRPPAELAPLGLEGPLGWIAEQLEEVDRGQLEWLWDLAADDLTRMARCVAAFEKRYPRSERLADYRRRLREGRRRRARRALVRLVGAGAVVAAGLAGYDAWGFRAALRFEANNPATDVARRWDDLDRWHPTLPYLFPADARVARDHRAEWAVRAAQARQSAGTAAPDSADRLAAIKERNPDLAPAIRRVEAAAAAAKQESRWNDVKAEAAASSDTPEVPLQAVRGFLREYPESQHRAEADALLVSLRGRAETKLLGRERQVVDDLARAAKLPGANLLDLIEQARQFGVEHPDSRLRPEVDQLLDGFVKTLDERDIEKARDFSARNPTEFARRIERYNDYLQAHKAGGRYISEATEAKDRILRAWDTDTYRRAYDHLAAHPNDIAAVAAQLRDYLAQHPEGRRVAEARRYLAWWDKVSVPNDYHVTLRSGTFPESLGSTFGGAPDLSVTVEVAGATHGPSPVIRNNYKPIWDYRFPQPIRWKLGDPVTIRVTQNGYWSNSDVVILSSKKGDPLALRNLAGTIHPTKGGATSLVFAADFQIPDLPRPE